jgi:hypothetical protein
MRRRNPCRAWPPPSLSTSNPMMPIKAINRRFQSSAVFSFPLAFFTPGRFAGHLWQAAGSHAFSFLFPSLSVPI